MPVDEIEDRKPLSIENNQPLTIENQQSLALDARMYVFTLCTAYTKLNDYKKLERHIERYHLDFQEEEKGSKRKKVYDNGNNKMKKNGNKNQLKKLKFLNNTT